MKEKDEFQVGEILKRRSYFTCHSTVPANNNEQQKGFGDNTGLVGGHRSTTVQSRYY